MARDKILVVKKENAKLHNDVMKKNGIKISLEYSAVALAVATIGRKMQDPYIHKLFKSGKIKVEDKGIEFIIDIPIEF